MHFGRSDSETCPDESGRIRNVPHQCLLMGNFIIKKRVFMEIRQGYSYHIKDVFLIKSGIFIILIFPNLFYKSLFGIVYLWEMNL